MRLLVVSLFAPLPANNGVKMRTWSVLQTLATEGHAVHLLCPSEDGVTPESETALTRVCAGIERLPVPRTFDKKPWKQFGRASALLSSLPSAVARARSKTFRRAIESSLARLAVDAIVLEQSVAAVNLPTAIGVPVVVDFHNVDHMIYERYARYVPRSPRRGYAMLEKTKFANWEGVVANRAAAAWVCSETDACLLQPLAPSLPLFVAPNVVDVESYTPGNTEQPFTILFQGGMDWYPNQDAVDFFVRRVFPQIRKTVPQAEFVIAGKNPPKSLRRRLEQTPRVRFTGTVTDIRRLTSTAAVCVVPLRIGSGTRLKILEAAAMGKAIVSTRVGAEGLHFVPGKEIVLADKPGEFTAAVVDLLLNSNGRRSLGRAARRRVETNYAHGSMQSAVRAAMDFIENSTAATSNESPALDMCSGTSSVVPPQVAKPQGAVR